MRYVLRRKYLWIKVGVCMGWFGDFSILKSWGGLGWVGLLDKYHFVKLNSKKKGSH